VPADDVALATDGRTELRVSWKFDVPVPDAWARFWPEVAAVPAGRAEATELTRATVETAARAAAIAATLVRRLVVRME
jgi:hypothetical protein